MTKQRVRDLTDIIARVLHYQDSGEPDWATMDYAATKREYDELPKPIIERYMNDAKFHAQVQRAVSMVLELDRSRDEPRQDCQECANYRATGRDECGCCGRRLK